MRLWTAQLRGSEEHDPASWNIYEGPPPNNGLPWTEDCVTDLRASLDDGASIAETAEFLCRTEEDVRAKMFELNLTMKPTRVQGFSQWEISEGALAAARAWASPAWLAGLATSEGSIPPNPCFNIRGSKQEIPAKRGVFFAVGNWEDSGKIEGPIIPP